MGGVRVSPRPLPLQPDVQPRVAGECREVSSYYDTINDDNDNDC